MIEKIVVHECSYDENGTRRQDIEIYYSFVGKIDRRPAFLSIVKCTALIIAEILCFHNIS